MKQIKNKIIKKVRKKWKELFWVMIIWVLTWMLSYIIIPFSFWDAPYNYINCKWYLKQFVELVVNWYLNIYELTSKDW